MDTDQDEQSKALSWIEISVYQWLKNSLQLDLGQCGVGTKSEYICAIFGLNSALLAGGQGFGPEDTEVFPEFLGFMPAVGETA